MKKKVLLILVFSICFFISKSQIPVNRGTPAVTVVDARLRASLNFGIPIVQDTTLNSGLDSVGSMIYVNQGVNKGIWYRDTLITGNNAWQQFNTSANQDTILAELPLYITRDPTSGLQILKILHADGILTPGIVSWSGTGLTFDVTSAVYYLNYVQYISPSSQITLDNSDPALNRIDKIGVDTNSLVIKATGTLAANPVAPQLNPPSQLPLTDIYILAGTTNPTGITQTVIYDENTAPEWTASTTGTITTDYDNLVNPYHLVKAGLVSTYTDGAALVFTSPNAAAAPDAASGLLKMFVYINGAFTGHNMFFSFYNDDTLVSVPLALNAGYGFNPLDSNAYQNISIPLSAFTFTGTVFNKIVITLSGDDLSGSQGFYIDYVQLQSGIIQPQVDYSNKVDSVTSVGRSLYYWIKGLATFVDSIPLRDTIEVQLPLYTYINPDNGRQVIAIQHADGIITPGIVTKSDCWQIDVTEATYSIGFVTYQSPTTSLSIDTADATFGRIDAVVVDTNNVVSVLTGTPSATPVAPVVDPSSQLLLTTISVAAGASCLGINLEVVYDGIVDDPAQWDTATTGTIAVDFSNVVNPYHLAQAGFVSTYQSASSMVFTKPSGVDTAQPTEVLKMFVYIVGAFTNNFQIRILNGATVVGNPVSFNSGYGFNPLDSNAYQNISIPFSAFGITTQAFDKVSITMSGDDLSGSQGFYIDYIQLQTGVVNPNTNPIDLTAYHTFTQISDTSFTLNDLLGRTDTVAIGASTLQHSFDASVAAADDPKINAGSTGQSVTITGTGSRNGGLVASTLTGDNPDGSRTYAGYFANGLTDLTSSFGENVGVYGTATGSQVANYGVYGEADLAGVFGTGSSTGVLGQVTSSGAVGVSGQSTSGWGIYALSSGVEAGRFDIQPASNNTVAPIIQLNRSSSSVPVQDGVGGSLDFYVSTAAPNNNFISNQVISKWLNATTATRTSEFSIKGVTAAAQQTWLTLGTSGYMQLRPMTATEASALTPAEAMIVFTSNTNGTFTSIGLWDYENGAWHKL